MRTITCFVLTSAIAGAAPAVAHALARAGRPGRSRDRTAAGSPDPRGWIANAPAAWSVIPLKRNIFFSDNTSGLWAIRLAPAEVTS